MPLPVIALIKERLIMPGVQSIVMPGIFLGIPGIVYLIDQVIPGVVVCICSEDV
jgi:hypothetical protein